jgi:hypothetical protein
MSTKRPDRHEVQTRRSVSMSGDLYDALRAYGVKNVQSMSDIVETEMRKFVGLPPREILRPVKHHPFAPVRVTPVEKGLKVEFPDLPAPVSEVLQLKVKPWHAAGFATRDGWRASRREGKPTATKGEEPESVELAAEPEDVAEVEPVKEPVPEYVSDLGFRKMLQKKDRNPSTFSPFYAKPPKKKVPEPQAIIAEPPKVMEKPDPARFEEWVAEQPRDKVEVPISRLPQASNIVLL